MRIRVYLHSLDLEIPIFFNDFIKKKGWDPQISFYNTNTEAVTNINTLGAISFERMADYDSVQSAVTTRHYNP